MLVNSKQNEDTSQYATPTGPNIILFKSERPRFSTAYIRRTLAFQW